MQTGAHKIYAVTMVSGATTAIVNLTRAYEKVYVHVPTMSTAAAININVSLNEGLSYVPHYTLVRSSTVQFARIIIPSSITNAVVEIPGGYQYYQIEATGTVGNGAVFRVIGNY